jgi:hypothetical protein
MVLIRCCDRLIVTASHVFARRQSLRNYASLKVARRATVNGF